MTPSGGDPRRTVWLAVSMMLLAGCSSMPPPVPMFGSPSDVARLEGAWSGDYYSTETFRSGSIVFELAAGADTAYGDVVMFPRRIHHARSADASHVQEPAPATNLSVRFVVSSGDRILGQLEPYEDPECRCTLLTQFSGQVRGDTLEGQYTSVNARTGEVTRGQWKVRKQRADPGATKKDHP